MDDQLYPKALAREKKLEKDKEKVRSGELEAIGKALEILKGRAVDVAGSADEVGSKLGIGLLAKHRAVARSPAAQEAALSKDIAALGAPALVQVPAGSVGFTGTGGAFASLPVFGCTCIPLYR